jgi:hypothetical protein
VYEQIIAIANDQEKIIRTQTLGEKILKNTPAESSDTTTSVSGVPSEIPETSAEERREPNRIDLTEVARAIEQGVSSSTTQSTSSRVRSETVFVEVASSVVIGEAASIESILANFNGFWTKRSAPPSQYEAALAQAQASYDAAIAHIGALQDAVSAGICDEQCTYALASLQSEIPIRRSHINQLAEIVREDRLTPRPPPPPTLAQIHRVAESVTPIPSGDARSPTNPSAPPTRVQLETQETPKSSGEVPGEAIVLRIVNSVWEFLKSFFIPPPKALAPRETCSLFLSLLGRCK